MVSLPPMLILQSTVTFQLDRTAQRTWWVPSERDSLCSFSFSFSIVPHDQPKFFAPLTASSIPVPLAIEEVARRPCLMPAADLVVRAAAAAVLALSSDREMQPLECSGASRTSERGR